MPARLKRKSPRFYVYVIRLLPSVLEEPDFFAENPRHRVDKPCVYVGSTYLTPLLRYRQHVAGYKSCSKVRKHHDARSPLIRRFQCHFPERRSAEAHERTLAATLRGRGYAVWQN